MSPMSEDWRIRYDTVQYASEEEEEESSSGCSCSYSRFSLFPSFGRFPYCTAFSCFQIYDDVSNEMERDMTS